MQSSFPEADQGDISGLSRSVSNLGSSLAGSVMAAVKPPEGKPFAVALGTMLAVALTGLVIALLIPRQSVETAQPAEWPRYDHGRPDPVALPEEQTPSVNLTQARLRGGEMTTSRQMPPGRHLERKAKRQARRLTASARPKAGRPGTRRTKPG